MGGPAHIDGKAVQATDNFLPCKIIIDGKEYLSAQNYFQASKTLVESEHDTIRKAGPGEEAWEAGSKATLRDDWDYVRVEIMYKANWEKFTQNPDLASILVSTKGPVVIDTAEHGFWGIWNAVILQRIRAELRRNEEEDQEKIEETKKKMREYKISKTM